MIADEKLMPLVDAVQAATGRRPHLSTVWRWCTRGARGIRLECRVLGGRRYTSPDAVARWMELTTIARDGESAPVTTPRQRQQAADRAAKQLAKRLVGAR